MKISTLYGSKIYGRNGNGYIIGILREENRILQLKCASENEKIFFVNYNRIKTINGELYYTDKTRKNTRGTNVRLGKDCFFNCGKHVGKLTDLECIGEKITHFYIAEKKRAFEKFKERDAIILGSDKNTPSSLPHTQDELINEAIITGEYVKSVLTKL